MLLPERVQEIIAKLYPSLKVEIPSENEIIINGSRLSLQDIQKILHRFDKEDHDDVIKQYIAEILNYDAFSYQTSDWESVVYNVMPRIHHKSLLDNYNEDMVAHTEWVNDCIIVYVYDSERACVSLTNEQLEKWSVTIDDVDYVARANIEEKTRFYEEFKVRAVAEEKGHIFIYDNNDGYASSRLLCDDLWDIASPVLGTHFLAAIPTRDTFCLCSLDNDELKHNFWKRACTDYIELPYPITDAMFLVTRDGVAPWKPWL